MAETRRPSRTWPHFTAPALVAALVFGGGLAISLAWFDLGDLAVESDFLAELAPAAQHIADGELSVHNHPYKGPVQPLVLAAMQALGRPFALGWYRAGVLISLLSAAGVVFLVHQLVLRLSDRWTAVVAIVFLAGTAEFFINAHKASSDLVFLLLFMATVRQIVIGGQTTRAWYLAGVLAGLTFLTRYIGVVASVWALVAALYLAPRRRWQAAGWVAAGLATVTVPWFGLGLVQAGRLVATDNVQNIINEFYGPDRSRSSPSTAASSLWQLVAHDPAYFLGHWLANAASHLRADFNHLTGPVLGTAAGLGLLSLSWRGRTRGSGTWLALAAVYVVALALVFYRPRFALPLLPLYALAAAHTLSLIPRARSPVAVAVIGVFLYMHGAFAVQAISYCRDEQPRHLVGAIGFLAAANAQTDETLVVMARKPHAAHYSRSSYRPYPRDLSGASRLLREAARRDSDYLLVGQLEKRFFPADSWLDRLASYEGVTVAWSDSTTTVLRLDADNPHYATRPDIEVLRARWRRCLTDATDDKDAAVLAVGLARLLSEDDNLDDERAMLAETIAKAHTPVFELRVGLSWLCWQMKDHRAGVDALAGHLAGEPANVLLADGHEALGRNLLACERTAEAATELGRALQLFTELDQRQRVASLTQLLADIETIR